MTSGKISKEEMVDAIQNSGYLIEQRVESVFVKRGYAVETNDAYQDNESGKSREVDLTAIRGKVIFVAQNHFIFPYILVECENNHQPAVFFRNNPKPGFFSLDDVKVSGLPFEIPGFDAPSIPIANFLGLHTFHHYCSGPFSTQYCSFQLVNKDNKKKWISNHPEVQHDTFMSLIKCLEYKISEHHASYILPKDGEKECLNLQFYYPLIILQGDLYEAYEENGELKLEERDHIQFRKLIVKANTSRSFQIDVIREDYLPEYLEIVDRETNELLTKIRDQWPPIEYGIARFVENERVKEKTNQWLAHIRGSRLTE